MKAPAATRIYATTIVHARTTPLRTASGTAATPGWSTSTTCPDSGLLRPLAELRVPGPPRGRRTTRLRENLDTFLATQGIDLEGGRILMLAMPRVLGTVFNPISVYWCHTPDGRLACNVVEVHNTYGDRHAYLVHADDKGHAEVDKALYVSPFNDVSGRYRLTIPTPGRDRAACRWSSTAPTRRPFVAGLPGRALPVRASDGRCASPSPSPSNPLPSPRGSAGTASACGCAACRCSRALPTTRRQSSDHRHRRPVHAARHRRQPLARPHRTSRQGAPGRRGRRRPPASSCPPHAGCPCASSSGVTRSSGAPPPTPPRPSWSSTGPRAFFAALGAGGPDRLR